MSSSQLLLQPAPRDPGALELDLREGDGMGIGFHGSMEGDCGEGPVVAENESRQP